MLKKDVQWDVYFNWTCSENTDHKHVKTSMNSSKDRFPPKTNKSRFGNPKSRRNGVSVFFQDPRDWFPWMIPNCTYFQNTSSSDITRHTCRVIWYECEIPKTLVFAVVRHRYHQSSSRRSQGDFMVISGPHWRLRQMAFCQHQVGHYTSCSNFCFFWCPRAVCDLKEINVKR